MVPEDGEGGAVDVDGSACCGLRDVDGCGGEVVDAGGGGVGEGGGVVEGCDCADGDGGGVDAGGGARVVLYAAAESDVEESHVGGWCGKFSGISASWGSG